MQKCKKVKSINKLRNEHSAPNGVRASQISIYKSNKKTPEMQLQMQEGSKIIYKKLKNFCLANRRSKNLQNFEKG